jgi:hypothetical protein
MNYLSVWRIAARVFTLIQLIVFFVITINASHAKTNQPNVLLVIMENF